MVLCAVYIGSIGQWSCIKQVGTIHDLFVGYGVAVTSLTLTCYKCLLPQQPGVRLPVSESLFLIFLLKYFLFVLHLFRVLNPHIRATMARNYQQPQFNPSWRNWLARQTVNLEVVSSTLTEGVMFLLHLFASHNNNTFLARDTWDSHLARRDFLKQTLDLFSFSPTDWSTILLERQLLYKIEPFIHPSRLIIPSQTRQQQQETRRPSDNQLRASKYLAGNHDTLIRACTQQPMSKHRPPSMQESPLLRPPNYKSYNLCQ